MSKRDDTQDTKIGIKDIKQRRLEELKLKTHPDLYVGGCVPFYFCFRSIMLYILHKGNCQGLDYHGGQGPIVHLEADVKKTVAWADDNNLRWAFTLSNAGSCYFDDYTGLENLNKINWKAVQARYWKNIRESKQAEFLVEKKFCWNLVERIGVYSDNIKEKVISSIQFAIHKPQVERICSWYY